MKIALFVMGGRQFLATTNTLSYIFYKKDFSELEVTEDT